MRSHQPKQLRTTTPRPLFSCGFFRHCTQTALSPTTSSSSPTLPLSCSDPPPPLPLRRPPPTVQLSASTLPPLKKPSQPDSESSSSSNTSQSFTQWRFPLPNDSPISKNLFSPAERVPFKHSPSDQPMEHTQKPESPRLPPVTSTSLQELFHVAELQLGTGSESDQLRALYVLERSLVPNPPADADGFEVVLCPATVMRGIVWYLKEPVGAKPASKVLLALCLVEGNRRVAVEVGAVGGVVEALSDLESGPAGRALAALELLCTVEEGAEEVRAHALTVPMMVEVMGRLEGRGKENAICVLAVIYGSPVEGLAVAPPEEVARAVALALQGDCSARGRRKGAQLLRTLQENGRLDLTHDGR